MGHNTLRASFSFFLPSFLPSFPFPSLYRGPRLFLRSQHHSTSSSSSSSSSSWSSSSSLSSSSASATRYGKHTRGILLLVYIYIYGEYQRSTPCLYYADDSAIWAIHCESFKSLFRGGYVHICTRVICYYIAY